MRIMKSSTNLNKLKNHLAKLGLEASWAIEGKSIHIGPTEFRPLESPDEMDSLDSSKGLILGHTKKELRKSLRSKNINYLDADGNWHLATGTTRILFEEKPKTLRTKNRKIQSSLRPTLLISPNGLALVELLFRLNPEVIESYAKVFQFCQAFNLYQPKVSKIMTAMKVKNLLHMKKRLREIPLEWWIYALESPVTKRKMTAFYDHSETYYSLDSKFNEMQSSELLPELLEKYRENVTEGPSLVANQMGEILDNNISLWISPEISGKIKRDLKLIAGKKEGRRQWQIASPPYNLQKADLISHAKPTATYGVTANVMRAIWDLSFSEARMREARENLLRRFLA